MAKRARASRSTHRPGGQGPSRSRKTEDAPISAAEPVADAVSAGVVAAPGEVSGVVESEGVLESVAAEPESKRTRRARRRTKTRPDDLAARASAENAWVREDLRRIGIVSVILLVSLAVAWVLFVAVDVLSLY